MTVKETNSQKPLIHETTIAERSPYRLNLTLNPDSKNELEKLRAETQKSSLVDVIRAALAVYKVIVEHQRGGGRVVFRNPDNSEETLRFI
jgi:hypothetical protein